MFLFSPKIRDCNSQLPFSQVVSRTTVDEIFQNQRNVFGACAPSFIIRVHHRGGVLLSFNGHEGGGGVEVHSFLLLGATGWID